MRDCLWPGIPIYNKTTSEDHSWSRQPVLQTKTLPCQWLIMKFSFSRIVQKFLFLTIKKRHRFRSLKRIWAFSHRNHTLGQWPTTDMTLFETSFRVIDSMINSSSILFTNCCRQTTPTTGSTKAVTKPHNLQSKRQQLRVKRAAHLKYNTRAQLDRHYRHLWQMFNRPLGRPFVAPPPRDLDSHNCLSVKEQNLPINYVRGTDNW